MDVVGNASLSNVSSVGVLEASEGNFQSSVTLVYLVVRCVEGLLAVIGNTLTIIAVLKYDRLRTITNILICSLAAADFLGGLDPVFVTLTYTYESSSPLWMTLCLTELTINTISCAGNVLSILLITIDRYVYISLPLRYESLCQSRRVISVLLVLWMYVTISIPSVISLQSRIPARPDCQTRAVLLPVPYYSFLIGQFYLFSAAIVGLYAHIGLIAWRHGQTIANGRRRGSAGGRMLARRENKITKMMGLVLGVYFMSYVPALVISSLVTPDSTPWLICVEKVGDPSSTLLITLCGNVASGIHAG